MEVAIHPFQPQRWKNTRRVPRYPLVLGMHHGQSKTKLLRETKIFFPLSSFEPRFLSHRDGSLVTASTALPQRRRHLTSIKPQQQKYHLSGSDGWGHAECLVPYSQEIRWSGLKFSPSAPSNVAYVGQSLFHCKNSITKYTLCESMLLAVNSDYNCTHHYRVGICNADQVCLLWEKR